MKDDGCCHGSLMLCMCRQPPPPPPLAHQLLTVLEVEGSQGNSSAAFEVLDEDISLSAAFSDQGAPAAIYGLNASSLQVLTRPAGLPLQTLVRYDA